VNKNAIKPEIGGPWKFFLKASTPPRIFGKNFRYPPACLDFQKKTSDFIQRPDIDITYMLVPSLLICIIFLFSFEHPKEDLYLNYE
jgi:hypothetical protein